MLVTFIRYANESDSECDSFVFVDFILSLKEIANDEHGLEKMKIDSQIESCYAIQLNSKFQSVCPAQK